MGETWQDQPRPSSDFARSVTARLYHSAGVKPDWKTAASIIARSSSVRRNVGGLMQSSSSRGVAQPGRHTRRGSLAIHSARLPDWENAIVS